MQNNTTTKPLNQNKMLGRIQRWWKFEGKYYHKDIYKGIKNIIHWLPTIWKDRDYDHHYIYEVLRVKLEKQAKYILERGNHVSAQRDAELMLLCARLCRIQQEDLYSLEYLDYRETEWDFIPTDETKQWYTLETTTLWENYQEYFEKYPKQHKRALSGEINHTKTSDEEKEDYVVAMEIAHENQERSRKLLFKIMEQNISRWWD
jgi:hypothetical protein